jgi:hypothetical protein
MLSLATKTDRTLFFDFLPIDLGTIRGMKTKIQLYTVPGQVFYDTTRKLVLKGADGVVFVADSQSAMADANLDSFENLITNLKEQNFNLEELPHMIQYNKRDMKNIMSIEECEAKLNRFNAPYQEACALKGEGVFETLKGISKLVLQNLGKKYGMDEDSKPASSARSKGTVKSGSKPPDLPSTAPPPAAKPPSTAKPTPSAAKPSSASVPESSPNQPVTARSGPDGTRTEPNEPLHPKAPSREAAPVSRPVPPTATRKRGLEPISSLGTSEVVETDRDSSLEVSELNDMAEIADMASKSTEQDVPVQPDPIEVPIAINLPKGLGGTPLRIVLNITFSD